MRNYHSVVMLLGLNILPYLAGTKSVRVGATAKFRINATGTKPLGYQRKKNGEIIVGATKPAYTTPPATLADDGALFSVVVKNRAGSVVSDNARLTVW